MQLAKWLILFGFVSLGSFCFSLPTFKILVVLELSAVATHSSSNDIIDISMSMISFRRWEVVPRGVG